jgi:hypothetical protein
MRLKTHVAVFGLLVCASVAQAQVKAAGALKCDKPDVTHKVDVDSTHSFLVNQSKCSPDKDKPFEIGGVKSGSAVSTDATEVQGNKASFHGYYVDTMENGDKGEYRFQGSGTMKDGVMQSADDSWTLVRGTGKLKGAKGKGTCKGAGTAEGSVAWECAGEITLASK